MDVSDDFYKERFTGTWEDNFKQKPTRKEVIAFMWGMSAGEDRMKKIQKQTIPRLSEVKG